MDSPVASLLDTFGDTFPFPRFLILLILLVLLVLLVLVLFLGGGARSTAGNFPFYMPFANMIPLP